jgi:heterodisulfide reductase subunit A
MEGARTRAPNGKPASDLIVGGGIGGMRAALDLPDSGTNVYVIEQTACLGGRVAQPGFMFPQQDCMLCRGTSDHGFGCTRPSISPAFIDHNQHLHIDILTQTTVLDVEGQAGERRVSDAENGAYDQGGLCK